MVVVEEVKDGLELGVVAMVGEGRKEGGNGGNQNREKREFFCLGNGNFMDIVMSEHSGT